MVHRINIFLLSFFLVAAQVITMNQALAGAAEKWELIENVYDSSKNTVKVTAKKITQQAANSGVYKVEVPVNATTLGSTVKRMLWVGAAVGAVSALIEGVGWVIDEGSKVIKKPLPADLPQVDKFWLHDNLVVNYNNYIQFGGTTAMAACQNIAPQYSSFGKVVSVTLNGSWAYCNFERQGFRQSVSQRDNQWKDPNAEPKFDIISDAQLGDLILGKSNEQNAPSTPNAPIIESAYNPNNPVSDAPAPQQTNDALDNANPQPEKEPEGKSETEKEKDPETGEETGKETSKFELPNFCEWAPAVCDFFTVQKQDNKEIKLNQNKDLEQNKTFFGSVKDWFDWSKKEVDYPDTQEVEIDQTVPEVPNTSYFNWGAYCPFSPGSQTISLENTSAGIDYDLTSWCELASDFRPFVLAAGSLMAFLIASGVIMGRND